MADAADGLTFILPVFDAEKTLAKAVGSWMPTLDSLGRRVEIVIVDDGSTDGTKAQADLLAAKHSRLVVLHHETRRGYGACLRTALDAATQPIAFYTSVDHGWNPADLPRLLKSLDVKDEYSGKSVEFVNGHRRGTVWPSGRKWMNRISRGFKRIAFGIPSVPPNGFLGKSESSFWWKCRVLFGLRVGDINSKFKLFRRSALERIEIQSDGEFVHAELLAKANFLGVMMDEVILADRDVPAPAPDVQSEMWKVFKKPKFKAPVVAADLSPPAPLSEAERGEQAASDPQPVDQPSAP